MRKSVKPIISLLGLLAVLAAGSCSSPVSHPDWAPDVKKALNDFIRQEGRKAENKYVVFDFDNTCSIFDVSVQLMSYQLEKMCFALDPEEFSKMAKTGMEGYPEALHEALECLVSEYSDLYSRYGPFTVEGVDAETEARLAEDPVWVDFASDMGCMYKRLQEYMTADDAYLWTMGWFAGMTGDDVYDMAYRSHEKYSAVQTVSRSWTGTRGTYSWIDGIAVTDNIRELWKALDESGFDVWVCSASEVGPVMAAVDFFGLHDYCKGVLAMTMARDSSGKYLPEYDYTDGRGFLATGDGGWIRDSIPTRTRPMGPGKVTAVRNCLVPKYGGKGPLAGFMDSTGDFNFCTEFSSMRLVVCFNRASRKVTDGGGLIAEVAVYERETLKYNLRKAGRRSDIYYVLQGRDENGLRSLRPYQTTLRLGETGPKLFAGDENFESLEYFKRNMMTVKDIIETFSVKTDVSDPSNPLGFTYGFLDSCDGYRSKE